MAVESNANTARTKTKAPVDPADTRDPIDADDWVPGTGTRRKRAYRGLNHKSAEEQCIKISVRTNRRCKRHTYRNSRLCSIHLAEVQGTGEGDARRAKAGVATRTSFEAQRTRPPSGQRLGSPAPNRLPIRAGTSKTQMVVSEQARAALAKLGQPLSEQSRVDPKLVLLDAVRSAAYQQEVWEAMLSTIPPEDFTMIGTTPIPGSPSTSKGARIEVIQKNLSEATRNASRTAKLAIDAGIEERLVRLAEEQSALIADTVKAALIAAVASLALPKPDEALAINNALAAAAGHLRLLASAAGGPAGSRAEIIDGIAVEVGKPVLP